MTTTLSNVPLTISDRVYQELRDRILHGELEPGTRLVQRKLAAQFNTSSIPILEAIRRLERDRLLVTQSKWGAEVNSWTIEDAEVAFGMREGMEGIAARLFVERATPAEKLMLPEYNRAYVEAARTCSFKNINNADIALHLYIAQCSKSANLIHLAEHSYVITATINGALRLMGKCEVVNPEQYFSDHDALVEALLGEDPQHAEQVARASIASALQDLLEAAGGKRLNTNHLATRELASNSGA